MANNLQQYQQVQEGVQVGSGLTRYRSAPSSYFSSFLDNPGGGGGFGSDDFERLFNPRASSPETQRIFSRFMNSGDTAQQRCSGQMNAHFLQPTKVEPTEVQSNDYSTETCSQVMYHQSRDVSEAADSSSVDNRLFGSFESNRVGPPAKMQRAGGACSSGLVRHSSSPAGLFANINIDEFGTVRAVGNIGGGNIANAEATFCSTSRFNRMDPITEITSKEMGDIGSADDDVDYITGFSMNSWEDDFHEQKIEGGNRPTTRFSHHLSLPKSSAMEKMLQDSVPCRTRAKRGCATHPRSIAERVRRTKISERMRKLQELVPNMEKQTNTSDMLDLAVEYIKDLQRQVTALSDSRAKCSCEAKLGS